MLTSWPSRFPSPFIKPDVPISGIRLSDWLLRRLTNGLHFAMTEPEYTVLTVDLVRGKLDSALRLHLVPPSQKMSHTLLDMFVDVLKYPPRTPQFEIRFPADQNLIQPVAHIFPRRHVLRLEMFAHFPLHLGHALLRRTTAEILLPRFLADVRSECISKKLKAFLPGVTDARLLFVMRFLLICD